jgi:hypothetical protein
MRHDVSVGNFSSATARLSARRPGAGVMADGHALGHLAALAMSG